MSRVTNLFPKWNHQLFHVLIFFNYSMRENKVCNSQTSLPTCMLHKHFKYLGKCSLLFKQIKYVCVSIMSMQYSSMKWIVYSNRLEMKWTASMYYIESCTSKHVIINELRIWYRTLIWILIDHKYFLFCKCNINYKNGEIMKISSFI
mgnify:CR=1 FL=1